MAGVAESLVGPVVDEARRACRGRVRRADEAGDRRDCRRHILRWEPIRDLHINILVDRIVQGPLFEVRAATDTGPIGSASTGGTAPPPGTTGRPGTRPRPPRSCGDASASCLRLLMHCARRAASRVACTAGSSSPTSTPITPTTTSSSINVIADLDRSEPLTSRPSQTGRQRPTRRLPKRERGPPLRGRANGPRAQRRPSALLVPPNGCELKGRWED